VVVSDAQAKLGGCIPVASVRLGGCRGSEYQGGAKIHVTEEGRLKSRETIGKSPAFIPLLF
jgi:hypothetical protein